LSQCYLDVLRLSFVSSFVGSFMPGGVDVVRVYGLGRTSAGLPLALTSFLVERLQSPVALVGLMLIGIAIAPIELPSGTAEFAWLGLLLLAIGVAAVMHPRGRRLSRFLRIDDGALTSGRCRQRIVRWIVVADTPGGYGSIRPPDRGADLGQCP
jgi:hypothetical protein